MIRTILFPYTPDHIKEVFEEIAMIEKLIENGGDYQSEIKKFIEKSEKDKNKYNALGNKRK